MNRRHNTGWTSTGMRENLSSRTIGESVKTPDLFFISHVIQFLVDKRISCGTITQLGWQQSGPIPRG
jgi:hypothetical protein